MSVTASPGLDEHIDADRLQSAAYEAGVRVFAERSDRQLIVMRPDRTVDFTVTTPMGISVVRGEIEIAMPVAEPAALIPAVHWAAGRMSGLPPGRYLLAAPAAAQRSTVADASLELAPLLHSLRDACGGRPAHLGFIAEAVTRSIVIGGTQAGLLSKAEGWSRMSCFATGNDGSDLAKTTHIGEWRDGDSVARGLLDKLVDATLADASRLQDALPSGPITCPVVFASRAAGTLLHEIVGHLVEKDNVLARRALPAVKTGARIAPEMVTVVHDGTLAESWSGANFDDAGILAQSQTIVDSGVVVGQISSERRAGFDVPAVPRIRTLRLAPGADGRSAAELCEGIERGLLVRTVRRAVMVPRTGRCVVEIGEAATLESGRIGGVCRGGTIVCSVTEILTEIDALGSDSGVTHDLCDKAGQRLPASAWSPALRVRSLPVR